MAAPVAANDVAEACREFATAEVIFVGRVNGAPITRRVSGEDDIEKARVIMEAAERELKAFQALKMPPEIGGGRHRELAIQAIKAQDEYGRIRAMHPPPVDFPVTPLLVETAFRGVTTSELFMWNRGQPALDPARSYLFYAERPAGRSRPTSCSPVTPKMWKRPKPICNSCARLSRTTMAQPSTARSSSRIPTIRCAGLRCRGVVLRVSLDGQRYESSTGADGTFLITGVPPGMLRIEPVLPDHLTLPPQSNGGHGERRLPRSAHARDVQRAHSRASAARNRRTISRRPSTSCARRSKLAMSAILARAHERSRRVCVRGSAARSVPAGRSTSRDSHRQGAPFAPTYFPGTTDRSPGDASRRRVRNGACRRSNGSSTHGFAKAASR